MYSEMVFSYPLLTIYGQYPLFSNNPPLLYVIFQDHTMGFDNVIIGPFLLDLAGFFQIKKNKVIISRPLLRVNKKIVMP